jgi:metal-sulfur cluster biosynthetic enzyme
MIIADIKSAVEAIESVDMCEVITTFDPPFGPEMMSEEARLALGI